MEWSLRNCHQRNYGIRGHESSASGRAGRLREYHIQMKQSNIHPVLAVFLFGASSSFAGPAAPTPTGKSGPEPLKSADPCEDIWALATLYKSESNPFIQEFALTGRYHGQFADMEGDHGDADGWDNRRFRYGFRAKLWHDFEVKHDFFADLNNGDWYAGFTESSITWKSSDALSISVGKQKPRFSLDWTISSREMLIMERSILINNLGLEYGTGLSVSGKQGQWSYYAGVFNNDVRDGFTDELEYGDLSGGWSWIGSIAYDLKAQTGLDKAVLRFDYIHMDHDDEDDLLTRFDDALALSFHAKKDQVGVTAEVLWAEGDEASSRGTDGEMWGFYFMPTYDITSKLQVVGRYTHAEGDDYTLRAQGRYERGSEIGTVALPGAGYGDNYNAYYLGLTYYLCGHKLKLMSGLEYSEFDGSAANGDNDAWTWVNGLRLYW
jgi:phosphate-selective porin OprO/OprP